MIVGKFVPMSSSRYGIPIATLPMMSDETWNRHAKKYAARVRKEKIEAQKFSEIFEYLCKERFSC
jgi:hypothetical protein